MLHVGERKKTRRREELEAEDERSAIACEGGVNGGGEGHGDVGNEEGRSRLLKGMKDATMLRRRLRDDKI